jgi:predicted CopG family antitoxin
MEKNGEKNIRLSLETWKALMQLKSDSGGGSFDKLIGALLEKEGYDVQK